MKKALKIVAVLVTVAGVLVALASVGLHFFLPPEKAKALILKQLTAHLKREIQMGDVSVGIFSGLSVSSLKISEAPNFTKGVFVSSDRLTIKLALVPLLFKKIEVKQLELARPMINVVRHADGKTFNFSDLVSTATASAPEAVARRSGWSPFAIPEAYAAPVSGSPAAAPAESSFVLTVSYAEIQNGGIHFVDKSPAKQSADIESLDLKLKNVSMTDPFTIQAFLKLKTQGISASLKLAGEAELREGSFKAKTCELSSGGSTLSITGHAKQLKSNQPSVDLRVDIKEFRLATLRPVMALPPELKIEGPVTGTAQVKGDQTKMAFQTLVDLVQAQVGYGKQFSKAANVPFKVTLNGDLINLQNLNLSTFKAVLGSIELVGHGKVVAIKSPQPQVNLHVESNAFALGELLGYAKSSLPAGLSASGKAQLAADVSGTQASSQIAGKFDAKDLAVAFGDKFVKPAGVPMRFSMLGELFHQTLKFQTLSAVLSSLELKGNGSVQLSAKPPKFQLAFKSNSFSLQDVAKLIPLAADYRPQGGATLDVRTSGTSDNPLTNGVLNLQNASVRYEQSDFTQMTSAISFTHQDVSVPKLTGKLNGSDFTLKLTGRQLTTKPAMTVDANFTEMDLEKLMPATPQAKGFGGIVGVAWAAAPPKPVTPIKTSGHLTVGHVKYEFYDAKNFDFKWDLQDVTPDLSRVDGTATFNQGAGIVKDVEKLVKSSPVARLVLLPLTVLQKLDRSGLLKVAKVPSLQQVPFEGIHGNYVLRQGVVDVQEFDLTGRDLSLDTKGTVGLAGSQALNLRVVMKFSLGAFPILIRGTLSDPSVRPDLRSVPGNIIQKYGVDLLKGMGVGGSQKQAPTSEPSPAPADSNPSQQAPPEEPAQQRTDPAKELEKALKNIFK